MHDDANESRSPGKGDARGDRSPHPLDAWLRRELATLYAEDEGEALPSGMAELARQLDEKLKAAETESSQEDEPASR